MLQLDWNKADSPSSKGWKPRLYGIARKIVLAQKLMRSASHPRRSYWLDGSVHADVINQIDKDIKRTSGGDQEIDSCLGETRAMLLRHAAEDTELGYCQGMNMVASLFAVAGLSQNRTYARFRSFIQCVRGLWLPGFPLLDSAIAQFELIAKTQPWYNHLCKHSVSSDMYLPQAWMASFATWLPLSTRVILLPHLEQHGLAGMLALSLAVLELLELCCWSKMMRTQYLMR